MAVHKLRNGTPMVTFLCESGQHGAPCDAFTESTNDYVVCHCPVCHPPCQRPACNTAKRVNRRATTKCPRCSVVLPLSGQCDDCD